MAFGRIIRARENKASNSHKKKDSFGPRPNTDRKDSANSRSDSPYSSGQISSASQNSISRRGPRPPGALPDDNFSASPSAPHSSSSSQHGWYDEASAGQKAEDCLKAGTNGVALGERPPLQFPDKLNADTAARLHSAFSSLIDRMEQQGRMKFNTKSRPSRDGTDTSSAASNRGPGPSSQLQQTLSHSAMQRRGTAESYDRPTTTSHSLSRSNSNLAPPSSAGSRLAHRELPLPPPQLSSLPQSPCYDQSNGRGYDDNLDSPTDPYCASNTYPPARSYYSAAAPGVANDSSRSRSSSNPHADWEESPISSGSSSHASRTRNLLGLTINTDAVAAQSRRFVRRPTVASVGQEDENTPSLVHDEERNENENEPEPDETVPVCESPSPFDIGNSPTIRKLDDPFNATYQEPMMLQSPPDTQDVRDTPVAAAPNTPAYNADEILQIVQQALLQTQASTQAISVEAIQAAVMNEMNCRRSKVNGNGNGNGSTMNSSSSTDGATATATATTRTRTANGNPANTHYLAPPSPESCFSYGSGRSSPEAIVLPPPSLDTSRTWTASMRKAVQSIAEQEITEHRRRSEVYSYERDDGEEEEDVKEEGGYHHHHHHHHPVRKQSRNADINSIPWPHSRHSRRGFPMRAATSLSNSSSTRNHSNSTSTSISDRSITPPAAAAAAAPAHAAAPPPPSSFPAPPSFQYEYPEIEAYPDFDIPIGLPDPETYPNEPLPPVPSGRARGMSGGERTQFESALKRPGRPYNSSPFAVGANHDRVPLARRVGTMQRRMEVEE